MPLIDELRSKYPGYADDELLGGLQATKYPEYGIDEIKSAIGYKPAQPKGGQFMSGLGRSFEEVPGLAAGVGAYAADVVGADSARDAMLAYATERSKKVGAAHANDVQSLTDAWDGKVGWLDFLANASGYVAGQALQSLALGGLGAIGAKALATQGLKELAIKTAADQVAKGANEDVAKEVVAKVVADAALKAQTRGAVAGASAQNFNMELGSIYPDAVEEAKGAGNLDAGDKFRVLSMAALATGVDTAAEYITAKNWLRGSKVGMGAEKAPTVFGSPLAARAAYEIPAGIVREGGTEAVQTVLEHYGAGQPIADEKGLKDIIDSAGVGAVGGMLGGAVGSLRVRKAEAKPIADVHSILAAPTVDDALSAFQAANTRAIAAPVTKADWELVDGSLALPAPPTATVQGEMLALPAPTGQPVLMADERGNVAVQPAVARTEALNRAFDEQHAIEQQQAERESLGLAPVRIQAPEVQSVLPGDLTTQDGVPYGSKVAANVRAKKEGLTGENVVEIPGAGWIVRPKMQVATAPATAPATSEQMGVAASLAKAERDTNDRKAKYRAETSLLPDGTRIGKWEKQTIAGDVFWINGKRQTIDVLVEAGQKATDEALAKNAAAPVGDIATPPSQTEAAGTEAPQAKVGDLVKLTKPGVNGRVNIAGTVTRIFPDGRLEVRTQQDGYMKVAPSELGHKDTVTQAPEGEFIRKATNAERMGTKTRQKVIGALAEQQGRPVVFKPYGSQGAGFYAASTESDQDRSHRKWRENYDMVAAADDLTKIASGDIERAINYADRLSQSEKRKGWDGSPTNKVLIESIDREIENLKFALKQRKPSPEQAEPSRPAEAQQGAEHGKGQKGQGQGLLTKGAGATPATPQTQAEGIINAANQVSQPQGNQPEHQERNVARPQPEAVSGNRPEPSRRGEQTGAQEQASQAETAVDAATMAPEHIKALEGKTVAIQVQVGDTGKTATMKMDAAEAVRDIQRRITAAEKLSLCLA